MGISGSLKTQRIVLQVQNEESRKTEEKQQQEKISKNDARKR